MIVVGLVPLLTVVPPSVGTDPAMVVVRSSRFTKFAGVCRPAAAAPSSPTV